MPLDEILFCQLQLETDFAWPRLLQFSRGEIYVSFAAPLGLCSLAIASEAPLAGSLTREPNTDSSHQQ